MSATATQLDLSTQPSTREYAAMARLEQTVAAADLDAHLRELVKIRVSQLNGCAFCLDMHTAAALEAGEDPRRLHAVAAWRESPFFAPHERAALALAEEVTLLASGPPSDDVLNGARAHFDDAQLAALQWAIIVINSWNRVAVLSGMQPPDLD